MALVLIFGSNLGCQTPPAPTEEELAFEQTETESPSTENTDTIDFAEEEATETEELEPPPRILPLLHPAKPESWPTQSLLQTVKLDTNTLEEIANCQAALASSLKRVTTDQELLSLVVTLRTVLKKDRGLFHWCFYKGTNDLDLFLQRTDLTWQQKSERFSDTMLLLWVMARSMADEFHDDHYYEYLRARYIAMLRDHFGRHVDSFAPPLDQRLRPAKVQESPATEELDS